MDGLEFVRTVESLVLANPGYEVVICVCPACTMTRGPGQHREQDWAVNHAEKKIYL